jgi:hypothetical protein
VPRNRSQALIAVLARVVGLEVAENPKLFTAPSERVSIVRQTLQGVLGGVFRLYALACTSVIVLSSSSGGNLWSGKRELISAECRASGDASVGTVVGSHQGNFLAMGIYAPLGQPIANQIEKGPKHGAGAPSNDHYIRLK